MTTALEPVPFDELAAVLTEAVTRATGGPAQVIPARGEHLACAIYQAGFSVVRQAPSRRQLTLLED